MASSLPAFVGVLLDVLGAGSLFSAGALPEAFLSWVGAGLSLAASLILTPLVLRVARRREWIAHPSVDRWHDRPVALLGGIALFGAAAAGVIGGGMLSAYTWPVWTGATLIFLVGLADDLRDVRPEAKLVGQIVATALLLYAGEAFWRGGPFWVSIPLTFLWVIGITNAVNLIDGLDGLAASITIVAATVLALIGGTIGQVELAGVAATLAGASLGFLVYNAKPARIFMGDCGSMFLGYMLAVVALGVQSTGEPIVGTLVPVVVLAVPIFDTTFVTVTRILGGRRVTEGGNDHTHHRLVRLGLSERGAVLGLSAVSALFALAALSLLWATAQLFLALLLLGLVASLVFGLYLVRSRSYQPSQSKRDPSITERIGAVMRALAGGIYWKSVGGVVADLLVVVAAFIVAYHLRFGGQPPASHLDLMIQALPAIVVLKVLVFYAFGLYHGVWRHAGTPEIVRLVKASTLASVLSLAGLVGVYGSGAVSVSALILDWMIATGTVGGTRFGFRALRQYFAAQRDEGRRVLVYGSSDHGLLVVRHLRQRLARNVVGLLDDDPGRHGLQVQGVKVLGGLDSLSQLVSVYAVDEVIVPVENTTEEQRRRIAGTCVEAGVRCQHFAFSLQPAVKTEAALSSSAGDGAPGVSQAASTSE
jgi:UDP-GlcNAc:undecaprenyl-phosphate GlcNAc-1-phosphate transferase